MSCFVQQKLALAHFDAASLKPCLDFLMVEDLGESRLIVSFTTDRVKGMFSISVRCLLTSNKVRLMLIPFSTQSAMIRASDESTLTIGCGPMQGQFRMGTYATPCSWHIRMSSRTPQMLTTVPPDPDKDIILRIFAIVPSWPAHRSRGGSPTTL
jgi:hypothetical protein